MNNFLKFETVINRTALSRSTLHLRVKQGLLTPPVRLSSRCSVWPEHEISAINAARIAQKSDDEIRTLVKQLQEKRVALV